MGSFTHNKKTHKLIMTGGGHGQANIDFLKKHRIANNITIQYNNGVRFGNVSIHRKSKCRIDNQQCWFPENWNQNKIKKAGLHVISLKKNKKRVNRIPMTGTYKGVKIGLYSNNGFIKTIFPWYNQKGGIKYDNRRIK